MTYGLYQRNPEQINFGDLTKDVISAVSGIEDRRQAKRDALDKQFNDFKTVIDGWETTKTQTVNEFVLRGADKIRNQIYDWNKQLKAGQISEAEYKERMNNANSGWEMLANSAKTYDKTIQDLLSRQQFGENGEPPKGGAVELALADFYGDFSDIGNKQFVIGENGTIGIGSVGDDGNISSVIDVRTINLPGNQIADRVDLNAVTDKSVEQIKPWLMSQTNADGTSMSVEDARKNPAYTSWLIEQSNAIAGDQNPKAQASILLDNGGDYSIYRTDAQKKQIIDEKVELRAEAIFEATGKQMTPEEKAKYALELEKKMIPLQMQSNGELVPMLTDEQKKEAKKITQTAIEVKLGRKEDVDVEKTYHAPRSGGGGGSSPSGSGSKEDEFAGWATYGTLSSAWLSGDSGKLNTLSDDYEFVFEKSGIVGVYKKLDKPRIVKGKNGKSEYTYKEKVATVKDARDLAPYVYKKGKEESQQVYDSQKIRYMDDPNVSEEDKNARRGKKPFFGK